MTLYICSPGQSLYTGFWVNGPSEYRVMVSAIYIRTMTLYICSPGQSQYTGFWVNRPSEYRVMVSAIYKDHDLVYLQSRAIPVHSEWIDPVNTELWCLPFIRTMTLYICSPGQSQHTGFWGNRPSEYRVMVSAIYKDHDLVYLQSRAIPVHSEWIDPVNTELWCLPFIRTMTLYTCSPGQSQYTGFWGNRPSEYRVMVSAIYIRTMTLYTCSPGQSQYTGFWGNRPSEYRVMVSAIYKDHDLVYLQSRAIPVHWILRESTQWIQSYGVCHL